MTTIQVSDVELAKKPLPVIDREHALRAVLNARVEQLSPGRDLVLCDELHPLVDAATRAFCDHRPLVLSPDVIWFCLAQGFAHHVSVNAESLRARFVRHQGKMKLIVERPDFLLGKVNPWPEVFGAFSDQIAGHVGKLRDLVVADFSTTGPTERASFEVTLMDTFQPYFEYEVSFICGIPSIILMGTPDDWRSVRRRAAMLSEFGLEWWLDALMPVLDELVRSSEGRADRAFWQSFYHRQIIPSSRSGCEVGGETYGELTGWIHLFFPYLVEQERDPDDHRFGSVSGSRKRVKNPVLSDWEARVRASEARGKPRRTGTRQGPSLGEFPAGTASAPVLITGVGDGADREVRFVAGLFGVSQSASGALVPEFGWAVVHEPPREA